MAWSATPLRQYPEDHDFGKAFNEDIVGKVMWLIEAHAAVGAVSFECRCSAVC